MTYVDLQPHSVQVVRVFDGGQWRVGRLKGCLVSEGDDKAFHGVVQWSSSPGQSVIGCYNADSIRTPQLTRVECCGVDAG